MLDRVTTETTDEDDMQFREHPAVQGKRDFYPVDPRKLKVDPDYNVRNMTSKETRDHIAWLKASITAPEGGGVHVPLEVRLDGKSIYVTAGHCRLAAVMEAIAEGHEIDTVPCIPEAKGTNEIDRVVNLVISNSGKPLAALEVAAVVKRLVNYGWAEKKIAERLGWKSANTVKQHLEMLALPEPVKQHVRDGEISATLARNIAKNADPEEAEKLIRDNLEENKRIKGKRNTKVTAKTIKRDKAKAQGKLPVPPPKPVEQMGAALQEVYADHTAPAPKTAETMTEAELREGLEAPATAVHINTGDAPDVSADVASHLDMAPPDERPINGTPQRQGVKELIEALAPFAQIVAETNVDEYAPDDTVLVPFRFLLAASAMHAKATGGEV